MNDRLISLNAAIEAVHNYWIAEGHKLPRKMVGEYEVLDGDYKSQLRHNKMICEAITALPSAQPTLYGYDLDLLNFIAFLMREKGLTPEEAVTRFIDYGRMAEWIRSQVLGEIERTIKEQCGIG